MLKTYCSKCGEKNISGFLKIVTAGASWIGANLLKKKSHKNLF